MLLRGDEILRALVYVLSTIRPDLDKAEMYDVEQVRESWSVFAIACDTKSTPPTREMRDWIEGAEKKRGIRIVQVVGDSAFPFDREQTIVAEQRLHAFLEKQGDFRLLWGFTGKRGDDGGKDVNQIVNDWIDAEPEARSRVCFANIVDEDSVNVLKNETCMCPLKQVSRRNFIALCGGARFGDDMCVSDPLTDDLVVIEGGRQSFEQAVSILKQGGKVHIMSGLRRESEERFSAAAALRKMRDDKIDVIQRSRGNIIDL